MFKTAVSLKTQSTLWISQSRAAVSIGEEMWSSGHNAQLLFYQMSSLTKDAH